MDYCNHTLHQREQSLSPSSTNVSSAICNSCATDGLRLEAMNQALMLDARPGVFCAGEMLDWEAPTGGYLLQACFASGLIAARGAIAWQHRQR